MLTVRIGTRGSKLALAQADGVRRALRKLDPSARIKIVIIKTAGDEFQSVELFKRGGTGFFTKAIEKKLIQGDVDIAVHSLKDLPTELPKGLALAAYPKRLPTGDVLLSRRRYSLRGLPAGSVVGTASPRRQRQLTLLRPDLVAKDMRGNLDTRVSKVLKNEYDAVLLAKAGLLRLKKYLKYAHDVSPLELLPAVGQAALGLEVRAGDARLLQLLKKMNHADTEAAVRAERAFLRALGGGCRVPAGIHSRVKGSKLYLKGAVFSTCSNEGVFAEASGPKNRFEAVGKTLARKLLKKGAARFMKEARQES